MNKPFMFRTVCVLAVGAASLGGCAGADEAPSEIHEVATAALSAGGGPWVSGGYDTYLRSFEALRPGWQTSTLCTVFSLKSGEWGETERVVSGTFNEAKSAGCKNYLLSLRLFPEGHRDSPKESGCGIWNKVARGDFDAHYKEMGRNFAALPDDFVLRMGWELNGNYPWTLRACDTSAGAEAYKAGFRRIVDILRAQSPRSFAISWNFIKDTTKLPLPIDAYYPGGDFVDYVSVDYYDNPGAEDAAGFDRFAARGDVTRPIGIESWFAYARSKGKKLAFDEWGVVPEDRGGAGDDPAYIEKMFGWFSRNKAQLGYENYFNGASRGHALGGGDNPKSTAAYRRLWGGA